MDGGCTRWREGGCRFRAPVTRAALHAADRPIKNNAPTTNHNRDGPWARHKDGERKVTPARRPAAPYT